MSRRSHKRAWYSGFFSGLRRNRRRRRYYH